jgi:hypothetical protein
MQLPKEFLGKKRTFGEANLAYEDKEKKKKRRK